MYINHFIDNKRYQILNVNNKENCAYNLKPKSILLKSDLEDKIKFWSADFRNATALTGSANDKEL